MISVRRKQQNKTIQFMFYLRSNCNFKSNLYSSVCVICTCRSDLVLRVLHITLSHKKPSWYFYYYFFLIYCKVLSICLLKSTCLSYRNSIRKVALLCSLMHKLLMKSFFYIFFSSLTFLERKFPQNFHTMISILSPTIKIRNKHLSSYADMTWSHISNFRLYEFCIVLNVI